MSEPFVLPVEALQKIEAKPEDVFVWTLPDESWPLKEEFILKMRDYLRAELNGTEVIVLPRGAEWINLAISPQVAALMRHAAHHLREAPYASLADELEREAAEIDPQGVSQVCACDKSAGDVAEMADKIMEMYRGPLEQMPADASYDAGTGNETRFPLVRHRALPEVTFYLEPPESRGLRDDSRIR